MVAVMAATLVLLAPLPLALVLLAPLVLTLMADPAREGDGEA